MPQQQFIHLHLHSAYSLAEGAIKMPDLINNIGHLGHAAVAVTDTNNMFGALEFSLAAQKVGIQPIIGCQIRLGHEGQELVLLVQNEEGYLNLSRLVSDAYMHTEDMHKPLVSWAELEEFNGGLICLSGGLNGPVSQYLLHNQAKDAEKALHKLKKLFPNRLYMEIQRHGLREEAQIEEQLLDLAYKHDVPLVATNDSYFLNRKMHQAHDALLCIAEGRYVSEEDRRKVTPDHYLKSTDEMVKLFVDLPEAIANTVQIAKRCSYLLQVIDPILPPFECDDGRDEVEELKHISKEGLKWRLENFVDDFENEDVSKRYWDRLDFELNTIIQMGFPGYFLICSDFIRWAKDRDIPVGPGRGSGAGSIVAWALKITDLDPLEFNLLFERFLNPERVSMPDFDVDFCQDRREEVITYVQEKYGRDKVAQIITFGKLQARAVVRDVGRVLQMSYGQVDRLAKMIPSNPANPVTLQQALNEDADLRNEIRKDETSQRLIDIALELEGLFRHAGTHAAGLVIGDRPLHELVPLYRDPRSPMPVTQFNMKYVEQAGLVKFDFLGLKTLTVIHKAVKHIKEEHGVDVDPLMLPFDDKKTYDMIAAGNTVGVFQLESSGMRSTLAGMKPDRFEDIIALVSLYRPGPMENIPLYNKIKAGLEEPDYMHPNLEPILTETFGIMIYQEQVMQAAQLLSGYSLGGADLLRRAMGKKIKEEMDKQRKMFVDGATEHNDIPESQSNQIFDQIAKFAGYGFNKSHAAAYALIAYQTAWLKANYPVEFMAASMTLDKGNTDKLAIFKQDCDTNKIELLSPDINMSNADFKVEGESVRYALSALKGVGEVAMETVVAVRDEGGAFKDVFDFAERVNPKALNKRQIQGLAAAGGFESLNINRATMFGNAEALLRYAQNVFADKDSGQGGLFGGDDVASQPRPPMDALPEWQKLDKLAYEFKAVGFYLSAHPLDQKMDMLQRLGVMPLGQIEGRMEDQDYLKEKVAGVLIKKQVRVGKSGNKFAFLQISDPTGVQEIMIFGELLALHQNILETGSNILIDLEVKSQEDSIRMSGQSIRLLDEALKGKTRLTKITFSSTDTLPQLKELLAADGTGQSNVHIILPYSDSEMVEMEIKGDYALTPDTIHAIQELDNVTQLKDV
jgi:DNA polymerase-3 subunit alpha